MSRRKRAPEAPTPARPTWATVESIPGPSIPQGRGDGKDVRAAPTRPSGPRLSPFLRNDSFSNAATGAGMTNRDKRTQGIAAVNELDLGVFDDLYRGSDMAATIAEALPDEMTREGFEIRIEDDGGDETAEEVMAFLDELNVLEEFQHALTFARKDGGYAILLPADDGRKMDQPLNVDGVKSFKPYLSGIERVELTAWDYYNDPRAPKLGKAKLFNFTPRRGGVSSGMQGLPSDILMQVHESRLLLFDGVPVTKLQRFNNLGWGDSIFIRVWEVLRDYDLSWAGASGLLADWNQGVYKLAGLTDMILAGKGDLIAKRMATMDFNRSVFKSIAVDAGDKDGSGAEDFKREVASLTGLPEVFQQFALRLAAAARMPVSLLLGQAPAGLNATGDSDVRWYYDRIASMQRRMMLPQLKKLLKLVFIAKDGPTKGVEPENWSVKFNPLWQLSDLEQATLRKTMAEADVAYINAQVIAPQEVAASRFGGDRYSLETTLDNESRDAMESEPADFLEKAEEPDPIALEQAKAQIKGGAVPPKGPPKGAK